MQRVHISFSLTLYRISEWQIKMMMMMTKSSFRVRDGCVVLCCRTEVSQGGSLSLNSLTRFDAGVYSCHADNGVPPAVSKRVRLDVICTNISHFPAFFAILSLWNGAYRPVQQPRSVCMPTSKLKRKLATDLQMCGEGWSLTYLFSSVTLC